MHFLAIILVFSGVAHAQNQSWVSRLCQPLIGTKTQEGAKDIFKAACKRKVEEAGCANYFSDKDVPASDRNTCEFTQVELQMALPLIWISKCPGSAFDGFLNGPDIVNGTVNIVNGAVHTAWDVLAMVRSMFQPTPMARRHERTEEYKTAVHEQVDFLTLPQAKKEKLFEEAEAEQDRAYAAGQIVEKTLGDAKIALYCYSPKKQIELSCYGLGIATNNLMTATGAYKGAKYVGKMGARLGGFMSRVYKAAGFRSAPDL